MLKSVSVGGDPIERCKNRRRGNRSLVLLSPTVNDKKEGRKKKHVVQRVTNELVFLLLPRKRRKERKQCLKLKRKEQFFALIGQAATFR